MTTRTKNTVGINAGIDAEPNAELNAGPQAASVHDWSDGLPGDSWGLVEPQKIFEGGRQKHFSAKEVIYRETDRGDKVFKILNGMVKLLTYLPNGRSRIVRLHSHNHWFGLEGLIEQPYKHTAVAVGDVTLVYASMNSLHLLERDHPQQYCQVLKQAYRQLAQADRWAAEFSTGGIRPRVARLVDFLSKLEYGESSNRVELLTVHEMADMLGVTPESVSRILAGFKRNDILQRLESPLSEAYGIDAQRLQYEARQ